MILKSIMDKDTKTTSKLVIALAKMKKEDLILHQQKVNRLKTVLKNNPYSSVDIYRLKMAKLRCMQLTKTNQNLVQLEHRIKKNEFFSGE